MQWQMLGQRLFDSAKAAGCEPLRKPESCSISKFGANSKPVENKASCVWNARPARASGGGCESADFCSNYRCAEKIPFKYCVCVCSGYVRALWRKISAAPSSGLAVCIRMSVFGPRSSSFRGVSFVLNSCWAGSVWMY